MSDIEYVLATSIWARMKGLLGARCPLSRDEVLVLVPCRSIHTYGMRYSIDVAFVDCEGTVLKAERGMQPNRAISCKKAHATLERPSAKGAAWFLPGDNVPFRAYG